MRKFLATILVIAMLVSALPTVAYATETEIVKGSANLSFYDNPNQTETVSVATNGKNVWVNAEQLFPRLGYSVVYSSEKNTIMIYNTESNQLPVVITVFHCDDTAVSYLYYDTFYEKQYTAPFESFSDEDGLWVPFEYSLLLNRSSMLIDGNVVRISQPQKNIVDIFREIAVNNERIMFDWCVDFGYGTEEVFAGLSEYEWLHSANYLTLLLDGLLSLEGEAFITFFAQFSGESTGFDMEYGNTLTQLLCINSNDEYSAMLENAEKMNSIFSAKGTLGDMLTKMNSAHELEVGQLTSRCDELLEQIAEDNPISVLQYNREYQRLSDALAHQSDFESLGGSILDIQKGMSSAIPKTEEALTALEVLGYALEFFKQDDFSIDATQYYLDLCVTETCLSQAMFASMQQHLRTLESNFVDYSIYQFFANNWLDLVSKFVGIEDPIKNAMGTQANVLLLAWSLASNYIPFISNGLDSADQYMLGSYARLMEYDALDKYVNSKNSVGATANTVDLYKSVQLCYVFLKSCYISRDAGIASMCNVLDDAETSNEPLVMEHQEINKEIAAYMAIMKNAPIDNDEYAYGFLLDNNATYLTQYDDSKLIAIINMLPTPDSPKNNLDIYTDFGGGKLLRQVNTYYQGELIQTDTFSYNDNQQLIGTHIEYLDYLDTEIDCTYTYDASGRLIEADRDDFWYNFGNEAYFYNDYEQLMTYKYFWGEFDLPYYQYDYEYNSDGECIFETEYHYSVSTGMLEKTSVSEFTYKYDNQGRIIEKNKQYTWIDSDYNIITSCGEYWATEYDYITKYTYDSKGRMASEQQLYVIGDSSSEKNLKTYCYDYWPFVAVTVDDYDISTVLEINDIMGNRVWSITIDDSEIILAEDGYVISATENRNGYRYEFLYEEQMTDKDAEDTPNNKSNQNGLVLQYPISEGDCYIIYKNYFGYEMAEGSRAAPVSRSGAGKDERLIFGLYSLNPNTGGYNISGYFVVYVNTGVCERDDFLFQPEHVFRAEDYFY